MMKAIFYDRGGKVVWECTRDASYEFNNGSRAIRKGAVRGVLLDRDGQEMGEINYVF